MALIKKFQQVTSDISEVWALTARPELTYEVEVEDEDEDEDEGEGAGEENLRISSYTASMWLAPSAGSLTRTRAQAGRTA